MIYIFLVDHSIGLEIALETLLTILIVTAMSVPGICPNYNIHIHTPYSILHTLLGNKSSFSPLDPPKLSPPRVNAGKLYNGVYEVVLIQEIT